MPSPQSSAALVQSGLHILANIKPHVLKHPKMLGPQSLAELIAETNHPAGQYIHLMFSNNRITLPQSSNMRSPSTLTIGLTIYPQPAAHPKTIHWMVALLTPKWSAERDKSFTSCLSDILRCHSNLRSRLHKVRCTFW